VPIKDLPVSPVEVTSGHLGDVHLVTVTGELDLHGARVLEAQLGRTSGRREVVVDLLGVSFLDSAALGVLVGTMKRLRAEGGRLVLVTDDPRTLRVFQVTGLDRVFPLEPSLAAAIDAAVAATNGGSP
jgi:anti-sigma B factor antagonist